jgi:hypothetical protein
MERPKLERPVSIMETRETANYPSARVLNEGKVSINISILKRDRVIYFYIIWIVLDITN